MTLTTPAPVIERDRWGRPLVAPEGGGKAVAYTRCTTYIDVLEDKFNLQKWMQRQVAVGLANRPDLLLSVSAHKEDKRELDRICDNAREAAAASAAATTGTALHALTELIDRGQELPPLPDTATADLNAYAAATADLKATHIEQFCVLDSLKVGGTPDRIVTHQGKRYIADIKTGSIEWGTLKIAMQLAIYSRSKTYNIATGERGTHNAEVDKGIIIHLPAGQAKCDLYWVDLLSGWNAVQIARRVRDARALKFGDLASPFNADIAAAYPQGVPSVEETLAVRIAEAATADEIRTLWTRHATEWTDTLTAAAKARITELGA